MQNHWNKWKNISQSLLQSKMEDQSDAVSADLQITKSRIYALTIQ